MRPRTCRYDLANVHRQCAVKSLVGIVRVISKNVDSYRNGPGYVRELGEDAEVFAGLLEWVERLMQDAQVAGGLPSAANGRMVLERAEQRMLDLRRRVERVVRSSEGDIYRLKWLRSESTCRDLQRKLKDCYLELNTMVTLISAYVGESFL